MSYIWNAMFSYLLSPISYLLLGIFAWFATYRYYSAIVLLTALLPTYLIRFTVFGIPTTFLEVATWTLFLIGLLTADIRASWWQAAKKFPKPLLALIFLFLVAASISTGISPHTETSLGILKGWIITPMVFAWMVYAASTNPKSEYRNPKQSQNPNELNSKRFRKLEFVSNLGLRASDFSDRIMQALILSGLVVSLIGLSQLGTLDRIRSLYDVPNSLALFLAPLIVLAATQKPETRNQKLTYAAALVMFIALLFTQSVAGVASVLLVLGISLLVMRKKRYEIRDKKRNRYPTSYILLLTSLVLLSLIILTNKIDYLRQPASSLAVRLQLWSVSLDLIKQHPILGIGLGTFEPAYQQALHERFANHETLITDHSEAAPPLPEFVFRDPHNWLLSFWLNTGLIGLASFIGIHVYVFRKAIKSKHTLPVTHYSLLAAMATLLLMGLTDTIYWKNDLAALHWLLIALLVTSCDQNTTARKT